jgi:hypothetical protein
VDKTFGNELSVIRMNSLKQAQKPFWMQSRSDQETRRLSLCLAVRYPDSQFKNCDVRKADIVLNERHNWMELIK